MCNPPGLVMFLALFDPCCTFCANGNKSQSVRRCKLHDSFEVQQLGLGVKGARQSAVRGFKGVMGQLPSADLVQVGVA